jgi:HEAT repeat protein
VLRRALRDRDLGVRDAAALAVVETRDEQTLQALHRMLADTGRRARNRKRMLVAGGVGICSILFLFDYLLGGHHRHTGVLVAMLVRNVLLTLGGFATADSAVRRQAVSGLTRRSRPELAGAFATCLGDPDSAIHNMAARVLRDLLPQLKASDAARFRGSEMDALIRALPGKDTGLTMSILKALEQIGDDRAVPAVEELTLRSRSEPVRRAALNCLPYLKERAEETRAARTLLRASDAGSAERARDLLRPATGGGSPNELLRSTVR